MEYICKTETLFPALFLHEPRLIIAAKEEIIPVTEKVKFLLPDLEINFFTNSNAVIISLKSIWLYNIVYKIYFIFSPAEHTLMENLKIAMEAVKNKNESWTSNKNLSSSRFNT